MIFHTVVAFVDGVPLVSVWTKREKAEKELISHARGAYTYIDEGLSEMSIKWKGGHAFLDMSRLDLSMVGILDKEDKKEGLEQIELFKLGEAK